MAALCSKREYCTSQIRERLKRHSDAELSALEIDSVIDFLVKEGYLNDRRFALAYVNDKLVFNGWGRRKISYGLIMLGVASSDIEFALTEKYASKYKSVLNKLMASKFKELVSLDDNIATLKVIKYLTGRGFDYDEIRAAISYYNATRDAV